MTYRGSQTFEDCPSPYVQSEFQAEQQPEVVFTAQNLNAGNILSSAATLYKRKTDSTVQQLLDEFHSQKTNEDYRGKWMARGDSPTKRLICKLLVIYNIYRNEEGSSYLTSLSERGEEE